VPPEEEPEGAIRDWLVRRRADEDRLLEEDEREDRNVPASRLREEVP
jgi:hypothetical protein